MRVISTTIVQIRLRFVANISLNTVPHHIATPLIRNTEVAMSFQILTRVNCNVAHMDDCLRCLLGSAKAKRQANRRDVPRTPFVS
jgi:hypothetical protein